jgi:hypothetical protein
MSLVTAASPWTNQDTDSNKKRIPTMRKTLKKQPQPLSYTNTFGEPDDFVSDDQTYHNMRDNTIDNTQVNQDARAQRVNQLLNHITTSTLDNDGNGLANFRPLPNPQIQETRREEGRPPDSLGNPPSNPLQIPPPPIRHQESAQYGALDLGNYSNYIKSYEAPKVLGQANSYYSKMGLGKMSGSLDDKLLEKLNYLILLMEENQMEKTANITEEFILYTFLGVFVIFVVDSFARAGKYIR